MSGKAVTVKKVALKQQMNGYWRWRALGNRSERMANSAKPYSNLRDAAANMLAVVNPLKRKIPVTVTKKDGTKGSLPKF